MNSENAIEVKHITKKFKIYHDKGHMLKERALHWSRNKYEINQVLKDISFDVKKGEAIGLVGHNGCGKSTTLKMLTKIMYPDTGSIEMSGRVSSLLELGAGFHPDLSGRENIYINASIFGLSKKEIDKRVEEIIRFSELEEFIDNPVRTYSSGMYMRLAFSVAINVDAEILLIDEILGVGDANFQIKCFNKLMDIKRKGTTIVIVSHSLGQIEQICERSIWIHDGYVRMEGAPKEVHEEYLTYMGELRRDRLEVELEQQNNVESSREPSAESDAKTISEEIGDSEKNADENVISRMGSGDARYIKTKSFDRDGKEKYVFELGDTICFELQYKVFKFVKDAYFGLSIFRNDGVRCYGTNSKIDNVAFKDLSEDGKVLVRFDDLTLLPGQYYIDVSIEARSIESVDYWSGINKFEVVSTKQDIGVSFMKHEWEY